MAPLPAGFPDLETIVEAARRIAPHVRPTPLIMLGDDGPWLKAESLHPSGAFKLRGAFNAIASLTVEERARGVIAHSSGNHAMAVAYAARALGTRAVIVVPDNAPVAKIEGVKRYGGEIVTVGPDSAERQARAAELAHSDGLAMVDPYDAHSIIAATGTIALEILEQHPGVETIYAPVSGGGLIGGIALATKLAAPHVRLVGVEPEIAADALESFRRGTLVALPAATMAGTIADGLRVNHLGQRNWEIFRRHVDDVITVSEADILGMMRRIAFEARLVAEPSGAVAAAGAARAGGSAKGAVAILTGGNCDPELFVQALKGNY